MSGDTNCWTLIAPESDTETPSLAELKNALEKGSTEVKIDAMRRALVAMVNQENLSGLLMHVIRFVMPDKNKELKKLLLYFWEGCSKYDDQGRLKQEMILVCNAIRNDLRHPNEYIKGATLRFLCKLKEAEILEPLVPSVRAALDHRHAYVRKSAIFAVYTIHKNFAHLLPDGPELCRTFVSAETDPTCIRNAFVMLLNTRPDLAAEYFFEVADAVSGLDEMVQLVIMEFIRKDCRGSSPNKAGYIKCIIELLSASSQAVRYEAATTLTSLTANPTAIKEAASTFIDLVIKVSDNNVKLIVLNRLEALRRKHEGVLDVLIMDILRTLASPDMDVRRTALKIVLDMLSSRNINDVTEFLKKELQKTQDGDYEKNAEYRQLLVQSIHTCAIRFQEVAKNVTLTLMDYLSDSNNSASAVDVVAFVREVAERIPSIRETIIQKLLASFSELKTGKVYRGVLWIIGEYASKAQDINEAFVQVRKSIGEIPILAAEQRLYDQHENEDDAIRQKSAELSKTTGAKKVLADGTYATESAFTSTNAATLDAVKAALKPPIRALVLGGDYYTASVLSATLTKLVLRYEEISADEHGFNKLRAEAMLIMTSIIRVGQSQFVTQPIDEDAYERIMSCVQTLASYVAEKSVQEVFLVDTKAAYSKIVAAEEHKKREKLALEHQARAAQPDDVIQFRQFAKKVADIDGGTTDYDRDLLEATGTGSNAAEEAKSSLSRVVQLTGFSDPVYAEAYVNVHQFDVLLDVLVVNQTSETLQNLAIEFATLGDLKLVERPAAHTLGPHSFHSIKAAIKVSSTETGVIFGNIVFDSASGTDNTAVVLNDIHIDIMDYIRPATCTEAQFRSMWTEFEWENKINVATTIPDLKVYLQHIMKNTNMNCLTPEAALSGDCGFLSANLHARSIFGEDALANLSIEKQGDASIQGHVRIRSKTQGIALSLGDKITLAQKQEVKSVTA